MANCRICDESGESLGTIGVCETCRQRMGIREPGAPLRPARPCGRCSGTSFVRSWSLRERAPYGRDIVHPHLAPLAIAFAPAVRSGFWSLRTAEPSRSTPIGIMEAYVCRGCGLTEIYTEGAADIPIGPEFGTELIEVPGEGPFR
ncbi:MAG TPA: hypothetical protein VK698_23590 [Kofleriaceae bacterium]|nr:hypothetical protein [Kofleriaceae bacterium]